MRITRRFRFTAVPKYRVDYAQESSDVEMVGRGVAGHQSDVHVDRAAAQMPAERIDNAMIEKMKEEGLQRSKVMETISYLTDVHGPRLTGSPLTRKAVSGPKPS